MLKYFDRTFFKFLMGFAGMLSLGFLVLFLVGYYELEVKEGDAYQNAAQEAAFTP